MSTLWSVVDNEKDIKKSNFKATKLCRLLVRNIVSRNFFGAV